LTRRPFLAVLPITALALSGCALLGTTSDAPTPAGPAAVPSPARTVASGLGDSVKDAGDLPDPCTLLSDAEVTALTGRDITQIDRDGARPGDTARYCQWQQDGGQLAVFLSRSSTAEFNFKITDATPVYGLGEEAFQLAGHLYVLYGTVAVDVYDRGGSDADNLAAAKTIVNVLLPKI
jgi:uncharacterized protein DUF3558